MTELTWRGLTAEYTPAEQKIMRELVDAGATKDELALIHEAKASLQATIAEPIWLEPDLPLVGIVPTGHGHFQVPDRIREKLRSRL